MTDNRVSETTGETSRRAVMNGIVGVGVGVPILAACGSEDSGGSGGSGNSSGGSGGTDSGGDAGSDGGGAKASGSLGKASEVPVGGAKIFKGPKVMVSQPSEGEFKAFSTVCTHQGCPITKLEGDEIECGCHFSRFAVADGSVTNGPAGKPLEKLEVTVEGDDLVVS